MQTNQLRTSYESQIEPTLVVKLISLFYYILYLAEWFVSFVYHLFTDNIIGSGKVNANAYRASAFEMEAKLNQDNPNYLKERKWGAWFRYYGKI